jgi:cytochrome b561
MMPSKANKAPRFSVTTPSKHSVMTKIFHATLAASIIVQLITSQFMPGPDEVKRAWIFNIHQYSGLVAVALALGFWITLVTRRKGTALGALFPWFSTVRLKGVITDVKTHFAALMTLRLPAHDPEAALPSAVHGLGLLLMTVMAASGMAYYVIVWLGLHSVEPDDMLVMQVHFLCANLVWVYLIAHAGLAMVQHFIGSVSLRTMWSFKG